MRSQNLSALFDRCTLFSDKSGTKVFISYLRLLEDLNVVSAYTQGISTQAHLYRQLGYAFKGGVKKIGYKKYNTHNT